MGVLKKEIMKTQNKDLEKAAEYRQLLVQAIHSCAVKFPDVAGECFRSACCQCWNANNATLVDGRRQLLVQVILHLYAVRVPGVASVVLISARHRSTARQQY